MGEVAFVGKNKISIAARNGFVEIKRIKIDGIKKGISEAVELLNMKNGKILR